MSICIISDHIIMLRQNFIIILSILIKSSLNMRGGGGFSLQSPPPGSAPGWLLAHAFKTTIDFQMLLYKTNGMSSR